MSARAVVEGELGSDVACQPAMPPTTITITKIKAPVASAAPRMTCRAPHGNAPAAVAVAIRGRVYQCFNGNTANQPYCHIDRDLAPSGPATSLTGKGRDERARDRMASGRDDADTRSHDLRARDRSTQCGV